MKKIIHLTLTDKLLTVLLLLSIATAIIHPALSAVLCATIHLGVTILSSAIHIKTAKNK